MHKRIVWKAYAIYSIIHFVVVLFLVDFLHFSSLDNYVFDITLIITIIGVVAFAWEKAIFVRIFWRLFLYLMVLMDILAILVGFVYPKALLTTPDLPFALLSIINTLLSYVALYLYGSKKNPVWKDAGVQSIEANASGFFSNHSTSV